MIQRAIKNLDYELKKKTTEVEMHKKQKELASAQNNR